MIWSCYPSVQVRLRLREDRGQAVRIRRASSNTNENRWKLLEGLQNVLKESFGVAGCAYCGFALLAKVDIVKVDLGNTIILVCSHFKIFASFSRILNHLAIFNKFCTTWITLSYIKGSGTVLEANTNKELIAKFRFVPLCKTVCSVHIQALVQDKTLVSNF